MRRMALVSLLLLALASPSAAGPGTVLLNKVMPAGEPVTIAPHPACPLEISVIDADGDGLADHVLIEPDKACDDAFKAEMKRQMRQRGPGPDAT